MSVKPPAPPVTNAPTQLGALLPFPIAFGLLVMGAIAMGVSPVFVRLSGIGPFSSAFWRVFLALPILLVWAQWELKRSNHSLWSFNWPVVLCGLLFAGDLFFWHLSILNTTVANATLTACMAPVWVLLFAGYFTGEKVSSKSWSGLALCITGAAMLIGSSYQYSPDRIIGDVYGIITSMFFGLFILAVSRARKTHEAGHLTFLSTLITTAVLFFIALIAVTMGTESFFPETASGFVNLLALGVVSQAGGQGLMAVALGSLSAVFSSLVIFIEAVAGAIFGYLVFNETLTSLQWAGAIFILSGVWIARPR